MKVWEFVWPYLALLGAVATLLAASFVFEYLLVLLPPYAAIALVAPLLVIIALDCWLDTRKPWP
jgi:hypothetical protein